MSKENQIIADFMCNRYVNHVGKNDRYKWQLVKDGVWYEEKELMYDKSWDWLMPVFDKFTGKFGISWKISSTMVNIYNPRTNIDGRWEINCPENVIIDAWRGAISTIKDINQNKLNETN